MGLLLESNLQPGAQSWKAGAELERGVSITDACMGWDATAPVIEGLADSVRKRRSA